jgi:hypothetical protein
MANESLNAAGAEQDRQEHGTQGEGVRCTTHAADWQARKHTENFFNKKRGRSRLAVNNKTRSGVCLRLDTSSDVKNAR